MRHLSTRIGYIHTLLHPNQTIYTPTQCIQAGISSVVLQFGTKTSSQFDFFHLYKIENDIFKNTYQHITHHISLLRLMKCQFAKILFCIPSICIYVAIASEFSKIEQVLPSLSTFVGIN